MLPLELLFFIWFVKGLYLIPKDMDRAGPSPVLNAALPAFLGLTWGLGTSLRSLLVSTSQMWSRGNVTQGSEQTFGKPLSMMPH